MSNKLDHMIAHMFANDLSFEEARGMAEAVTYYYPAVSKLVFDGETCEVFMWEHADESLVPDEVFSVCDSIAVSGYKFTVKSKPTVGWFTNHILNVMFRNDISNVTIKNVHDPDNVRITFRFTDPKRVDVACETAVSIMIADFLTFAQTESVSFRGLRSFVEKSDMIAFGI
jgi:hypothetical protein